LTTAYAVERHRFSKTHLERRKPEVFDSLVRRAKALQALHKWLVCHQAWVASKVLLQEAVDDLSSRGLHNGFNLQKVTLGKEPSTIMATQKQSSLKVTPTRKSNDLTYTEDAEDGAEDYIDYGDGGEGGDAEEEEDDDIINVESGAELPPQPIILSDVEEEFEQSPDVSII